MMAGDNETPRAQPTVSSRREGVSANGQRPRPPGPNDVQPASGKGTPPKGNQMLRPRPWWMTVLLSFGPTLLLIGGFLWLSRTAASQLGGGGGGPFGLGRSRAKRYDQTEEGTARITFADVAGIDEAKASWSRSSTFC